MVLKYTKEPNIEKMSVKNWLSSLSIEILFNLSIYFWVWPDFGDGNYGTLLVNFLD